MKNREGSIPFAIGTPTGADIPWLGDRSAPLPAFFRQLPSLSSPAHLRTTWRPHSLDLHDTATQLGKQRAVTFTIAPDAHNPSGFDLLSCGLDEAHRGWVEKGDVLNTRALAGLLKAIGNG